MNADWQIGAWKTNCVSTQMEVTTVYPDRKILCGECKIYVIYYLYLRVIFKLKVNCLYVYFF